MSAPDLPANGTALEDQLAAAHETLALVHLHLSCGELTRALGIIRDRTGLSEQDVDDLLEKMRHADHEARVAAALPGAALDAA